jgi:WD40 repeat protein
MKVSVVIPVLGLLLGVCAGHADAQNGDKSSCRGDNSAALAPHLADAPRLIAQSRHSGAVTAEAFSPRGTLVATGSQDGTVKLWFIKTHILLQTFSTSNYWVHSVSFSNDGCLLAAGSGDNKIYIWSLDAQRLLTTVDTEAGAAEVLSFSRDSSILTATTTGRGDNFKGKPQIIEWDVQGWTKRRQIDCVVSGGTTCPDEIRPDVIRKPGSSPDPAANGRATGVSGLFYSHGYLVASLKEGQIMVWDRGLRSPIRTFQQPILRSNGAVKTFSLDEAKGDLVSVGDDGGVVRWNLGSGQSVEVVPHVTTLRNGQSPLALLEEKHVRPRPMPPGMLSAKVDNEDPPPTEEGHATAISPSGIVALGGISWNFEHTDIHGFVWLWNGGTRVGDQIKDSQRKSSVVTALSFSPDGKTLAIGFDNGGVDLWNLTDHTVTSRLDDQKSEITALVFSGGGRYLAAGGRDGTIKVWTMNSSQPARTLTGHTSDVLCLSFPSSDDDDTVASGGIDTRVILWRASSGERLHVFEGHTAPVNSLTFVPQQRVLLSGGDDSTVRFWNTAQFQPLATLVAVRDGSQWLATDPAGFFDGNERTWNQVVWQFNGNLFDVSPVEIGFRDYFVPNLLAKTLNAQFQPPAKPSVASLNRTQPLLTIKSVTPEGQDTVRVEVEAQSQSSSVQQDGSGHPLVSGVYDVRLFRNGQVVAVRPEQAVDVPSDAVSDLDAWHRAHVVALGSDGKATLSFPGVRVPRSSDEKSLFTAYAFNSDRVKSATSAAFEYPVQRKTARTSRRAYLIAMGVNANQSNWNLDVAVPSAKKTMSLLHAKLGERYGQVIDIPVYSDLGEDGRVTLNHARKAALKAVLDLLSGKPVDSTLRDEVDPDHQLQAATPDDAVVLYVASHGYADPQGNLYLIPFDTGTNFGVTEEVLSRCRAQGELTGTCREAQTFLQRTVSSADLSTWWQGVDGGELVMILDSCHSGAVAGKTFRPGPLGDPGFGQLSYDKRMTLLSASQPAQTELGGWVIGGEGRTLLVDSLVSVAQSNPKQNLAQWLKGVEQQLPVTMSKLYPRMKEDELQSPVLLDFSGTNEPVAIERAPRAATPDNSLKVTVH